MARGSADRYFQQEVTEHAEAGARRRRGPRAAQGAGRQHRPPADRRAARGDGLYRQPHDRRDAEATAASCASPAPGLRESHVHDIAITREAPNYRQDLSRRLSLVAAQAREPPRRSGGTTHDPRRADRAAIELLDRDRAGAARPADDVVGRLFPPPPLSSASKDRGAISEHVYAVLRHRAALDWWIARAGRGLRRRRAPPDAGALVLVEELERRRDIAEACDGDRFRPAPLDAATKSGCVAGARTATRSTHPEMPRGGRATISRTGSSPISKRVFGAASRREMAALNEPAPLDLRVNR